MSSIHLVPESVCFQNTVSGVQDGRKPAILSIGDILDAKVARVLSENRVALALQHQQLIAASSVPLSLGQKLRVQVMRIQPEILLRVLETEESETRRMNQGFRTFLSDPGRLLRWFDQAGKMIAAQGGEPLSEGVRSCLQEMSRMLNVLILSEETVQNSLFFKEFVSALGLDLEKRLLKSSGQPAAGAEIWRNNLKGLLSRMVEQLRIQNSQSPEFEAAGRLSAFAQDGLDAIETHQLTNSLLQSQDQALMFQLPLLLPSGLSMADVFFHQKRSGNENPADPDFTVAMFLDMDALGALMIEARFKDGRVGCSIRCRNPEMRAFIAGHLEQLNEALNLLGLQVDRLVCLYEPEVARFRIEHLNKLSVFENDAVNLFV